MASLVLYTPGPLHDPLTDLARLLLAGVSEEAIVERCEPVQFRSSGGVGSSGTNATSIHDFNPVAVTANGIEARGWYKFGEDWCNRQVGQSVSVLTRLTNDGSSGFSYTPNTQHVSPKSGKPDPEMT